MSFFDDVAKNWETPSFLGNIGKEGYKGNTVTQTSSSTSGLNLNPASELENLAGSDINSQYGNLKDFLSKGPGASAIDSSNKEQQNFIEMLRQIASTGGMPTAEDQGRAGQLANMLFNPQQTALNQSFDVAQQDAAKLAARLNRPVNDPIIQAKLQQERIRQQQMLDANRAAYSADTAQGMPFQRLQLQGQLADAQGSLASQAMSNRLQLLNLGNSIQSNERNWRLQTAQKYGNASGSQNSGGGLLGGLGAMNSAVGSTMSAIGSVYSLGATGGGGDQISKQQQGAQTANMMGGAGSFNYGGGAAYYNSPYFGQISSGETSAARKSRFTGQQVPGSMFGGSANSLFGTRY